MGKSITSISLIPSKKDVEQEINPDTEFQYTIPLPVFSNDIKSMEFIWTKENPSQEDYIFVDFVEFKPLFKQYFKTEEHKKKNKFVVPETKTFTFNRKIKPNQLIKFEKVDGIPEKTN